MHSVDEVLQLIRDRIPRSAALRAGANRRRRREDSGEEAGGGVIMDSDSPPFDRALLDGFAVRSADAVPGASLHIVGNQDASPAIFAGSVGPGQCLAINTGGVFPGADAVLMVEHSARVPPSSEHAHSVKVLKPMPPGYGVQKRGADAQKGRQILAPGTRLGPVQLAAAVSAGAEFLSVRRRLTVAILTTGDELVPPGAAITGGQIRNSNHPMLARLITETLRENGDLLDLGTCPDQEPELQARLQKAFAAADLTLVTGGMSMGTKDLVPPILKKLGAAFHVEKVRMKPGKPFVFATLDAAKTPRYIAGLPGNPVSAFVTFHLFVREILTRLTAETAPDRWITAHAALPFPPNGDREFFQPCTLSRSATHTLLAHPLPWRGSGDIFTLAQAHALARRPINARALSPGDIVDILPL